MLVPEPFSLTVKRSAFKSMYTSLVVEIILIGLLISILYDVLDVLRNSPWKSKIAPSGISSRNAPDLLKKSKKVSAVTTP